MMVVFRYDKTFEGLLTAVFDAYSRKTFPARLIGEGEQLPLFTSELHEVIPDAGKSARVWNGVEKKVSKGACDMLLHVWLSELPGNDELLLRYLRKVFDAPVSIASDFTDEDVLAVQKIGLKVSRERLHIIQFARFQKAADGIYFAPASPIYNVLPLTISHFCDRFADQRWLLYDLRRRYGYYYDLEKAVEVTLDNDEHLLGGKLNDAAMADDEKLFQEMWEDYTRALTIKERLNPKLQRQHMPRRFWKYMPEKNWSDE